MHPINCTILFEAFARQKVAIIGDVMLDTYWWGSVDRISPEAPVPVVAVKNKEVRIGGAGNVALNTVSLGAATTVFSVIGNDDDGTHLSALLESNNVNTSYFVKSSNRHTTNKIRIMSRNQQMMRIDSEVTTDINAIEEQALIANFTRYIQIEKPHVVIFEDYNKGVLTASAIQQLIGICQSHGLITTVDPKRKNFLAYRGVTIFKPNLKEVFEGLNHYPDQINLESLSQIHTLLSAQLQHQASLITLSEKGIFCQQGEVAAISPTHVRGVADVSGAGDTVIAVASLVYAATNDIVFSAQVANLAAGIVCGEVGTVAINKQRLLQECLVYFK